MSSLPAGDLISESRPQSNLRHCFLNSKISAIADIATWDLKKFIYSVQIGKSVQSWSLPTRMGQKSRGSWWHFLNLTGPSPQETVTDSSRWSNDDGSIAKPESLAALVSSLKLTVLMKRSALAARNFPTPIQNLIKTPVLIRTLILALIRVQILALADGGENLLIDAPGPRKSPEPSSTYRASKSESSSRSSKSRKSSKSGQHKEMVKPKFMGTVKHYMTDGSIQSRENSLKKTRTEIKEKEDKRKEVKKQERSAKKTSKLEALYRKIEKLKKEEKKLKKGIEAFEKW